MPIRITTAAAALTLVLAAPSLAGEAEIAAARSAIEGQIEAFLSGDESRAYSYAAPNIMQMFPTVDAFMGMVKGAYQPVYQPKNYSFGRVEEPAAGSVVQHVLLVGPDGKNYEAVYTLRQQPDGSFQITGVSLRASTSLST